MIIRNQAQADVIERLRRYLIAGHQIDPWIFWKADRTGVLHVESELLNSLENTECIPDANNLTKNKIILLLKSLESWRKVNGQTSNII